MLDSDLAEDIVNKMKINEKKSIKMVLKLTLTALKIMFFLVILIKTCVYILKTG